MAITRAGAVMTARLQSGLDALGNGVGLDASRIASSPAQIRALAEPLHSGVVASLAHAVAFVFLLAVPLMLLALFLATRMPELPLRTTITTDAAAPEAAPAAAPPGPATPVAPAPVPGGS